MRRFFRWQSVVPRLLLVIVVLLVVQYALGLAVRSRIVRSGEAAVGTRIELGSARVAPLDRQIVLNDLRLANPLRPDDSLLHAQQSVLDFAVRPLLNRQMIIEYGRVNGLHVVAPHARATAQPASPSASNWFADAADQRVGQWLADLNAQFDRAAVEHFESVAHAEALAAKMPTAAAEIDRRANQLQHRAIELQQATEIARANRLRNRSFFDDLPAEVAALRGDLDELLAAVDALPATLQEERQAIAAALGRDVASLRQRLVVEPLDDGALTAYLLRDQVVEPLEELMGWLRWARQMVPERPRPAAPRWVVRTLQLDGELGIGTHGVAIRGVLSGLTDPSAMPDRPLRLRLISAGPQPLELYAELDRTGEVPQDQLLIDCSGLDLPEVVLGQGQPLQVTLARSVGALSISVRVVGDELSGDIQLVQRRLSVVPAWQGRSNDLPLADRMEAVLGSTSSVATRLVLHGTIDQPACTLWSNLGPAVAEATHRAYGPVKEAYLREVLAEAHRRIDQRLDELERQAAKQRTQLESQLASVTTQLETLAAGQSPGGRISTDRLGHDLPAQSLFR